MARQERPIDPSSGPLEAFAWDLRKLRVEAGAPTYRTLARTTGYGASTLSQAANGAQRPSLDVVLAYVGACGGDVDDWRKRWLELDAELTRVETSRVPQDEEPKADAASDTSFRSGQAGILPKAPPGDAEAVPATLSVRRRRWLDTRLAATLGVVTVVLGAVGVAVNEHRSGPQHRASCPADSTSAAFTGKPYGSGVYVRRGASLGEPILYTIPANCVVGFTGYCIGEEINDLTTSTPDTRWLQLPDGGVIAAAMVNGRPPKSLAPSSCRHALPQPQTIELGITTDRRAPITLMLHANGAYVHIVGFAAFREGDKTSNDAGWRQIAFPSEAKPALVAPLPLDKLRNQQGANDEFLVAAVACLGAGGPTDVMDVRTVRADGTSHALTTPLDEAQRYSAERWACW